VTPTAAAGRGTAEREITPPAVIAAAVSTRRRVAA